MTKQAMMSYTALLGVAVVLATTGFLTAHASEVTGTLSSKTTGDAETSGDIGGTVTDDTSGDLTGTVTSGDSGGSSSSGGGSSSGTRTNDADDTPPGTVLGATTDETPTAPRFPNTGTAPAANPADQSLWSTMISFLKNLTAS